MEEVLNGCSTPPSRPLFIGPWMCNPGKWLLGLGSYPLEAVGPKSRLPWFGRTMPTCCESCWLTALAQHPTTAKLFSSCGAQLKCVTRHAPKYFKVFCSSQNLFLNQNLFLRYIFLKFFLNREIGLE